jgi:hypothetical protein
MIILSMLLIIVIFSSCDDNSFDHEKIDYVQSGQSKMMLVMKI